MDGLGNVLEIFSTKKLFSANPLHTKLYFQYEFQLSVDTSGRLNRAISFKIGNSRSLSL